MISLVGLRLTLITPHLEAGDHLRERLMSAVLLISASVIAIAASFVRPGIALWMFMLMFAGPLIRRLSLRRALADLPD
jgi:hypothetical protein